MNGESDLDSQYAMTLVTGHQPVTLYQTGDMEEGGIVLPYVILDI
jgi:tripeptidyl-peptidase-1